MNHGSDSGILLMTDDCQFGYARRFRMLPYADPSFFFFFQYLQIYYIPFVSFLQCLFRDSIIVFT